MRRLLERAGTALILLPLVAAAVISVHSLFNGCRQVQTYIGDGWVPPSKCLCFSCETGRAKRGEEIGWPCLEHEECTLHARPYPREPIHAVNEWNYSNG